MTKPDLVTIFVYCRIELDRTDYVRFLLWHPRRVKKSFKYGLISMISQDFCLGESNEPTHREITAIL